MKIPLRERHRAKDTPAQGQQGLIDRLSIGTIAHDLYKKIQSTGKIGWTGRKVVNL